MTVDRGGEMRGVEAARVEALMVKVRFLYYHPQIISTEWACYGCKNYAETKDVHCPDTQAYCWHHKKYKFKNKSRQQRLPFLDEAHCVLVCLIPPQPLTHSRDHACYFHAQARLAGSFMFIARSNDNHPLLTNEMISKATNLFVPLGGFQFHAAGLDVPRTFTEGVSCYERGRPGLTGVGAGPYVIIRIMFAIGNTSSISAR
ncbi:hypothetical protein BDR06DRAFT_447068 [Suillus hirtellus]|nr:hypothetical protein BDR06DRAFT_447068 [Suillus hirtellus]